MVLLGLLTLILAIALHSLRISSVYFNRIAIIILLYSGVLASNTLYTGPVGSGVGVFNGLFQITTLTQEIEVFIYFVAALLLLLGENQTKGSKGLTAVAEYPILVLFSVLGMSSLISSCDLISMFLSIELQSFAVYLLATLYRESEAATSAGLKYFLLGSLSSAIILLGSSLLYGFTGLTSFEGLYMLCSTTPSNHYIELSVLLIVIGLLFKVAAAPFHSWGPDVADGVPTMVTAWLTTMPKISLFVFMLELLNTFQLNSSPAGVYTEGASPLPPFGVGASFYFLLLISSLLSMIIGTIGGLTQYRIKRLFAFSMISHVGFLLLALSINNHSSIDSFFFYLIQYSLTNINVFFILIAFGNLLSYTPSIYSPIQFINQLKGQFLVNPLLSLSFAVSLFSLAGVPPLVGFFGKQIVLYSAIYSGYIFIALVLIFSSVISAVYYLKIIKVIFFDPLTLEEEKLTLWGMCPNQKGLTTSISVVISTITLVLIFFILNPTPLLNSTHLMTLTLFYH